MNRISRVSILLLCLVTVGCAAQIPAEKRDPRDPWERVNRVTYKFNDAVDRAIAKPAAKAYRKVAPQFVETGVSNFFANLNYPTVIVNNLLQGKLKACVRDTGRLVLNTTLGLGGLFDPATAVGLEANDEDFGQTLGVWGVSSGPYLVLPLLGPSTVRDGFGRVVDHFTAPSTYIEDNTVEWSLRVMNALDARARLLDAEAALESAYDPYVFMRTAYLQRREYQVRDGQVSSDAEDDSWIEEAEAELLEDEQDASGKESTVPVPADQPEAPQVPEEVPEPQDAP